MTPDEEARLPRVYPGNFRYVCPERDCGWWREVPAIALDGLIKQGGAHRAEHEEAA